MIDDTALPKKGTMSVGVAPQYCGQLGKKVNCQSLVSLILAQGEVPVLVGLRLFLPEKWTDDPARCVQAGVPEAAMASRAKGEIALDELDRLTAAGARFGTVLADAGYGASAAFRIKCPGRARSLSKSHAPGRKQKSDATGTQTPAIRFNLTQRVLWLIRIASPAACVPDERAAVACVQALGGLEGAGTCRLEGRGRILESAGW